MVSTQFRYKIYMLRRLVGVVCLIGLLAGGCAHGWSDGRLDMVDGIMENNPDSAWVLLQDMDTVTLGKEDRMRHRLLSSYVALKLGMDTDINFIFEPAFLHYRDRTNRSRENSLAHMIKAFQNPDSCFLGLREYRLAVELADSSSLPNLGVKAMANMASIYHSAYMEKEERLAVEEMKALITEKTDTANLIFAIATEGTYLYGCKNYATGIACYEQALQLAMESKNKNEIEDLLSELTLACSIVQQHQKALKYFDLISEKEAYLEDPIRKIYLVSSLCGTGKISNGLCILDSLRSAIPKESLYNFYYIKSNLLSDIGEDRLASIYKDSLSLAQDWHYATKLNDNIPQQESRALAKNLGNLRKHINGILTGFSWLTGVLIFCGVSAVLILIRSLRHKDKRVKRVEAERMITVREQQEIVDNLGKDLNNLRTQNSEIKRNLNEAVEHNAHLSSKMECLQHKISLQCGVMDRLLTDLAQRDSDHDQLKRELTAKRTETEKLVEEVAAKSKEVEGYRSDVERYKSQLRDNYLLMWRKEAELYKQIYGSSSAALILRAGKIKARYASEDTLKEIEAILNAYCHGMIDYIRDNVRLSDAKYRVLLYDICGFDYHCIAVLTDIPPKTVSSHKTRLRTKLLSLPEDITKGWREYIPMMQNQ